MADTAAAAAKAALLELQRPATLNELADITGHSYNNIRNGLEGCESVQARLWGHIWDKAGSSRCAPPQPAPHRASEPPGRSVTPVPLIATGANCPGRLSVPARVSWASPMP